MPNVNNFGVPPAITAAVFRAQTALQGALRNSLAAGVKLGTALVTAKASCRHGDWGKYLKAHFSGSQRMAERYVLLAREWPDPQQVPQLSLREALALVGGKRPKPQALQTENQRVTPRTAAAIATALNRAADLAERAQRLQLSEGLAKTAPTVKQTAALLRAVRRLHAVFAAGPSSQQEPLAVPRGSAATAAKKARAPGQPRVVQAPADKSWPECCRRQSPANRCHAVA